MQVIKCVLVATLLVGCLGQDQADVYDAKGNGWRVRVPGAALATESAVAGLRPIAFADGNEYELVVTDDELLARYQQVAAEPGGGEPGGPHGVIADIFGADDRVAVPFSDVTTYPYRAIAYTQTAPGPAYAQYGAYGCTMTLIGPSTAISAAHCFWDRARGTWTPQKSWTFGVSNWRHRTIYGSTIVSTNQASPTYTGCYWVSIPAGYAASAPEDFSYDYAVVEFSNSQGPTCNLAPGNQLGWYGWWNATTSQIVNNGYRVTGYSGTIPAGSSAYVFPSEITRTEPYGHVDTADGDPYIELYANLAPGDSGSGFAQELFVAGSSPYITGIVDGAGVARGIARRIDSTVEAFVRQSSAL